MPKLQEVKIIDLDLLDLTHEDWKRRFEATKVSQRQFAELTDSSRPRLNRVMEGDRKSLTERKPGVFVVPRLYTITLLALEIGLLTVPEHSDG